MTCLEPPARIAVIGIGNVLLGDDGVGPYVVELLRCGWELPPDVALVDAGTPGLDLANYLLGHEVAILIDAVAAVGKPGDVRVYRDRELEKLPAQPRVSPHDPAVREAIWITELADRAPRVILVGIIPETTQPDVELTTTARNAAVDACTAVLNELSKLGIEVHARMESAAPDAWWQRRSMASSSAR